MDAQERLEMRARAEATEKFGPSYPGSYADYYRKDIPALLDALEAAESQLDKAQGTA